MQGGGGGGTTAPTLNSRELGRNQARQNTQAAIAGQTMNMTNQVNPFGSLNYAQTGGYTDENDQWIPQYTATTTLNPQQQGLFDSRAAAQQGLFGLANKVSPLAESTLGRYFQRANAAAPLPDTQAFTDDAYRALTARTNQDIGTRREAERVNLANQGVAAGSDAYNRAFQPIDRSAVDASNQATIQSQTLADQFLNREKDIRRFSNEQDLGPLQAYAGILGLAGNGEMPQWMQTPTTQVNAADVTSPALASFDAQNKAYQAEQQRAASSSNALMGSLFGLGGSVLGGIAGGPFGAKIGSKVGGLFGL